MATLKNTQVTGILRVPTGTTAQRPSSPTVGMLRFNTQRGVEEYYDGSQWLDIEYEEQTVTDGLTAETAAPSASYLITNYPNYKNGYYHIKPTGYNGDAIYVFCDLEGTDDVGAGWIRVLYRNDYYSRSSPWTLTANGNPAAFIPSQEFFFDLSDDEVLALSTNSQDVRQRFETYGIGSVGWTYAGRTSDQYQSHVGINGNWYHSRGFGGHLTQPRPSGVSYRVGTSYTSFNSSGSDPTDANDGTWRDGTFSFRDTTGTGILPIKQISHADVDSTNEARYFPLKNGDDGNGNADGDGSRIWILI